MQGYVGLFELVIVLVCVLGWGFVELRTLRRDNAKARAKGEADKSEDRPA